VIGVGAFLLGFLLGFLLMLAMWFTHKTFFRRRPELAPEGFMHQAAPAPLADSVNP
jgi:hypothetical protein